MQSVCAQAACAVRNDRANMHPRPLPQDLAHSFGSHSWLQCDEGRAAMRRVLAAFSVHAPGVGYTRWGSGAGAWVEGACQAAGGWFRFWVQGVKVQSPLRLAMHLCPARDRAGRSARSWRCCSRHSTATRWVWGPCTRLPVAPRCTPPAAPPAALLTGIACCMHAASPACPSAPPSSTRPLTHPLIHPPIPLTHAGERVLAPGTAGGAHAVRGHLRA